MRPVEFLARSAVAVVAAFVFDSLHLPAISAQTSESPPALIDSREIELPDMRIVGLSPDGKWLAAATFEEDELCIFSASTLDEQSCGDLRALNIDLRFEDVVWSPDSTRVAFSEQSFITFRDGDLWVMNAQDGQLTNITDDGYAGGSILDENSGVNFSFDVAPAWTPDSNFVTYSRSPFQDGEPTGTEIAHVAAGGGESETLFTVTTDEPGAVYFGAGWSPDGTAFYYSLSRLDPQNPDNGIWVYDPSTGERRKLAGSEPQLGPLALLQVSPAADRLLGYYPHAMAQFSSRGTYVRLIDVETGEVTTPEMPVLDAPDNAGIWLATFSPDGGYLLEITRLTNPDGQVWTVDLASGEQSLLVSEVAHAFPMDYALTPTWSNDGTLFISGGIGSGYLFDISGGRSELAPESTPITTETGGQQFDTGDLVATSVDLAAVRSAPAQAAPTVLELSAGSLLIIIGRPIEESGETWWPVRDPETMTIGYIESSQLIAILPGD